MNHESYINVLEKVGASIDPKTLYKGFRDGLIPEVGKEAAIDAAGQRLFDIEFGVPPEWLHGPKVVVGDVILLDCEVLKVGVGKGAGEELTVTCLENGQLPRFYPPSKRAISRQKLSEAVLLTVIPADLLHLTVVWLSGFRLGNNIIDRNKPLSFGKRLSVHYELRRLIATLEEGKTGGKP